MRVPGEFRPLSSISWLPLGFPLNSLLFQNIVPNWADSTVQIEWPPFVLCCLPRQGWSAVCRLRLVLSEQGGSMNRDHFICTLPCLLRTNLSLRRQLPALCRLRLPPIRQTVWFKWSSFHSHYAVCPTRVGADP